MHRGLASAFLFLLLGCHRSGTWIDEEDNWRRAFGQVLPSGVSFDRSWYWRSSHLTREEAYFFAFSAPHQIEESLRSENQMQRRTGDLDEALRTKSCFDKPDWFPLPSSGSFEVWVGQSSILMKERSSGTLFLAVCQL
jgi:hypothetical protein